ncbi:calcium-binding protein [Nocardioides stalactiti]|uniref:calcium-binding protein n=1 Tax=Nocardioides stalactiti TaxID=2755356 RepID=UPI001601B13E|nr:calcium-binding protein [Nocardioides stalactiti]
MPAPTARRSRALAGLTLAAALITAPALTGPAEAGARTPSDRGPSAAPVAPACDLTHGNGRRDEFAHCTTVVVTHLTTPDVGRTTAVQVAVTSVVDLEDATLTVLTNDAFEVVDPGGFSRRGSRASGVGRLAARSRTFDADAGDTTRFSFRVRGVRAGYSIVQGRLDTAGHAFDGRGEVGTYLGSTQPRHRVKAQRVEPSPDVRTARRPGRSTALAPRAESHSLSRRAPNASCAEGTWLYDDQNGDEWAAGNLSVDVWDEDSGPDELLAAGVSYLDGTFEFCFESVDSDEGGGQEVYVVARTENDAWRVRTDPVDDLTYELSSWTVPLPSSGGTADFTGLKSSNPVLFRAFHAFDTLNLLFLWQADINPDAIDDPGDTRQMIINWTATADAGTYYNLTTDDIHLEAADPDARAIVVHEGAHALMDAIYDDDFPTTTNCNPHQIWGATSATCAWTEGWAEWVPARVLGDPFFRWPEGNFENLEEPTWPFFDPAYAGHATGDTVEGRVAAALIDLSDSEPDGDESFFWDRYSEGGPSAIDEEIYTTSLVEVSDTFKEFFTIDRPGEGDTGYLARAALFQNTINYTHRDPLASDTLLQRPRLSGGAPNPHDYSTSLTTSYWSGVAIQPTQSDDYDLRLYSDQAMTVAGLITTSNLGGGVNDYVLVDGNHRTGSFFPRAQNGIGSFVYNIEAYLGSKSLPTGTTTGSLTTGDLLRLWDVSVTGGQTNYVRIVPSSGLDVELLAHDSDGSSANAAQSRKNAVATSTSTGAGGAESISYSSTDSDETGLVVLRESGSGTFTIYRDTAAPTSPTVSIDKGYPSTYDTSVGLTLSATGGLTSVAEMQISTDGTLDTEAWKPYSTSSTVTVPSGTGTKTVRVRFRNQAGAVSATASDTIELIATPTCDGKTPTLAGGGVLTGTSGNDVIVGAGGSDTISGLGGQDTICGFDGSDAITDGAGTDKVFGGLGNDTVTQSAAADTGDVVDGGFGNDTVSYAARTTRVVVSLDSSANDGGAGEADNVMSSVENITGGTGDDALTGNFVVNALTGGGGADSLAGGTGNDLLYGGDGGDVFLEGSSANGADRFDCGPGSDQVSYSLRTVSVALVLSGLGPSGESGEGDTAIGCDGGTGGTAGDALSGWISNDTLIGGGGNDTLNGGYGADVLTGSAGADTLRGSSGTDTLNGRDGASGDSLDGGSETDTATFDRGDTVTNVP